jgi:ankyrin repeat protein
MSDQRSLKSLLAEPRSTKRLLAYLFYWLVGFVMLLLLILEFASRGEVSLQLPQIFFILILLTGPIFVVVFLVPTVLCTIFAHQRPRDPLLTLWSWLHILFWLFLFNNLVYWIDAFVAFKDTIYLAWAAYAVIASSLPIFYYLIRTSKVRISLVLALLISVAVIGLFWDPRKGEFDVPSKPTAESIALLRAAEKGDANDVRLLIQKGADIHVKDEVGFDPLHVAVFFHHYDVVKYLLSAGADPNTRGHKGPHTRNFAGSDSCGLVLGERPTVLATALRLGNAPIAELLVQNGAECSPDWSLSLSAALGDTEQLRSQLEALNGALEERRVKSRIDGAFDLAASRPNSDVMEVLLAFGADPKSGLWNAAAFSRPGNVKWLLEHGADPNFSEFLKAPPLMSGFNRRTDQTTHEIRDTVQTLIDAGADVKFVTEFSCGIPPDESVLVHAVRSGNFTAVDVLLQNAADTSWRDSTGMTAKDYAEAMGREDLINLLDAYRLE